jgi:hypothetical protein
MAGVWECYGVGMEAVCFHYASTTKDEGRNRGRSMSSPCLRVGLDCLMFDSLNRLGTFRAGEVFDKMVLLGGSQYGRNQQSAISKEWGVFRSGLFLFIVWA